MISACTPFLRGIARHQPFMPIIETMRGLWTGHTSTGDGTRHVALVAITYCSAILAVSVAAATWLFRNRATEGGGHG